MTRDELIEVKQRYLIEMREVGNLQEVSWDSLACADELVSDETIFEYYSGIDFVSDDFCCNASNPEKSNTGNIVYGADVVRHVRLDRFR